MSERLTKRDRYGHAYTNETIYDRGMTSKDGVHFEKHYFENGTSAYDGKPIDRLCDLEDKIEQGKLLELPCRVGDKVYRIWSVGKHGKSIAEFVVTNVSQIMENTWVIRYQKQAKSLYAIPTIYQCNFNDIGKTVFLDRASAEAKLREMKGADK